MSWVEVIKAFLRDVSVFSRVVIQRPLRAYQLEPARAILDSVLNRKGLTFAVVMSRQAGKNELSAQLEAYLMNLFQQVRGSTIVKASPTDRPQAFNSKMRLRDCLENAWNERFLRGGEGYIVRLGRCRAFFFSAYPSSNVVGATASVLLECDEAQDVEEEKWSKDFAPMGAATNVTTVFYGTIWSSRTMLARVMRWLREQEAQDGIKRVFLVPWEVVAAEVPAYGEYVRKEMARLGEDHPIVKTQYKLEEIDEAGRMFPPERMARMKGKHARMRECQPCEVCPDGVYPAEIRGVYALTVDVAGEAESRAVGEYESELEGEMLREAEPRKDSTVVTVFEVDLEGLSDPLRGFPTYRVVDRHWWTGVKHAQLYSAILDLVDHWQAAFVVVDATGVGAGVASFLAQRLGDWKGEPPGLVVPYTFSLASKSALGWNFLSVVETGRYKEYADDGAPDTRQFWREVEECEFEVLPGPGQRMRWGVRDPTVHDDMLISAALVAELDKVQWTVEVESEVIEAPPGWPWADEGEC
jgi:hypothetical protein